MAPKPDRAATGHVIMLEVLGERIAAAVRGNFRALWATVTARKPKPIAGVLEYAGVRITRHR